MIWQVGLSSAAIASAVNLVTSAIQGWRNRKAEDKRQLRELSVQLGVSQWEAAAASVRDINDGLAKNPNKPKDIPFASGPGPLINFVEEAHAKLSKLA